jgi:hypothetical protein
MTIFKHLDDVDMTYYEHLKFAMDLLYNIEIMAVKTFFHALMPNIFETGTTDGVNILTNKLNSRHIQSKL